MQMNILKKIRKFFSFLSRMSKKENNKIWLGRIEYEYIYSISLNFYSTSLNVNGAIIIRKLGGFLLRGWLTWISYAYHQKRKYKCNTMYKHLLNCWHHVSTTVSFALLRVYANFIITTFSPTSLYIHKLSTQCFIRQKILSKNTLFSFYRRNLVLSVIS